MHDFLLRMIDQHDLKVSCMALVICVFGTYATSALGRQAALSNGRAIRARWMALAVLAFTCSIWASSFLAMLGTRVAMPFGFAPGPMIVSFVVTYLLVALGATVTLIGRFPHAPAFGGAIAGLAVSVALYIGMSGFRVVGTIEWNVVAVVVSVLIGIALPVLATVAWVRSRAHNPVLPIGLFAFAVCGDHLVAMNAASISYDPNVVVRLDSLIGDADLLSIVGFIATSIVALTWTARTLSRKSRLRREAEKRQLQQLADVAVEGLIICNGSRIVWINRSLESMLSGERASYVGRSLESLLAFSPSVPLSHDHEIDAALRTRDDDDRATVPVRVITRPIVMLNRPHVVFAVRDQRERLRAEAEMERLANTDALTRLPNRARFNAVLDRMFATQRVESSAFALLSLDLDRFKSVNDTSGHAAGDAVLVEVARRLVGLVRQGDLVARLGGDEFSIVALAGSDATTIVALADRMIEAVSLPFVVDGRSHRIGVSVGIAFAGSDGGDPEALTRCADLALYRAKSEGRGIYRLFEDGMRVRMQERHGLEQDLLRAVERNEFLLYFQPQVDAATGAFTGAEALIRWMHPERGLVSPEQFIAVAEETNLISRIGAWVLRTACVEAARWPAHLVVSVNLSPLQLRDATLAATVAAALAWSGLPGRRLDIEITESMLIEDGIHVRTVLEALKRLGVRLSLDDFGTGYSSLGQLHRFPFDQIKIDHSFVRRLPDDPGSAAIVRAVVALARGLGLRTTAEGVEDAAQLRFVTEAGCDQIQGFLFSRPVAPEALPTGFRGVAAMRAGDRTGDALPTTAVSA